MTATRGGGIWLLASFGDDVRERVQVLPVPLAASLKPIGVCNLCSPVTPTHTSFIRFLIRFMGFRVPLKF